MDFDFFQHKINDSNVKTWLAGENNPKKFPGFIVLKKTFAANTELGISLAVAFAITNELKIFANNTPHARPSEASTITFFMVYDLDNLNLGKISNSL